MGIVFSNIDNKEREIVSDSYQMNASKALEERFCLAKKAFAQGNYKIALIHAEGLAGDCLDQLVCPLKSSHEAARYSIIIVGYSVSDDLIDMLASLKRYEYDADYEIILVNNGDPGFYPVAAATLTNYTFVDVGFNYGCSGGRNVGLHFARGKYSLFIDDDGILAPNAIQELIRTIESADGVTCRGRVEPKSENSISGGNYDKGDSVTVSIPDAEGISIWRSDVLQRFGGFDPLLSGHEGLCACAKIFRFYGPYAFLYTPHAILYHDYASGKEHDAKKRVLHQNNRHYLDHLGLPWAEINKTMKTAQVDEIVLRQINSNKGLLSEGLLSNAQDIEISIITTAKNGEPFLEDFVTSLRSQTHQNFNLIFVDDASSDNTLDKLSELWDLDQKINVIQTDGVGRSGALNLALDAVTTDVCVIADVDDVSIDRRFALTANYFYKNPYSGCLSFYCFNEESILRAARPFATAAVGLKDRCLIGMPASFPSFAFRSSEFKLRFDEELTAGVDCDWIYRNFEAGAADGHMLPAPITYYRIHDQQITTTKRDIQKQVALQCLYQWHESILGKLTEQDRKLIDNLSGWSKVDNGGQLNELFSYINRLSYCFEGDGISQSSSQEYLYLAWSCLKSEIIKRDYRNWRNTALELRKASQKSSQANKSNKKGVKIVYKDVSLPPQIEKIFNQPNYGFLGWRRVFLPFIFPVIYFIGGQNEADKFRKNPLLFMIGLRKKRYHALRRFLFPQ